MLRLATLIQELDISPSSQGRIELLTNYLLVLQDPDELRVAVACLALAGRKIEGGDPLSQFGDASDWLHPDSFSKTHPETPCGPASSIRAEADPVRLQASAIAAGIEKIARLLGAPAGEKSLSLGRLMDVVRQLSRANHPGLEMELPISPLAPIATSMLVRLLSMRSLSENWEEELREALARASRRPLPEARKSLQESDDLAEAAVDLLLPGILAI